jgi:hypothetical protein
MNVPFSLLLAAERAIHPGTVAAGKEIYPDIARKSVGHIVFQAPTTPPRERHLGDLPWTSAHAILQQPPWAAESSRISAERTFTARTAQMDEAPCIA